MYFLHFRSISGHHLPQSKLTSQRKMYGGGRSVGSIIIFIISVLLFLVMLPKGTLARTFKEEVAAACVIGSLPFCTEKCALLWIQEWYMCGTIGWGSCLLLRYVKKVLPLMSIRGCSLYSRQC